jgi:hypothetical protein
MSHTYPYVVTSTTDPDAQGGVQGIGGYAEISATTPWQGISQSASHLQQSKYDRIAFIAPQEMTRVKPETMLFDLEGNGLPINLVRGTEIHLFDSITGALHVCTAYGYFIDEHDEPGIIVIENGKQARYSSEQVADILLPEEYPCR